MKLVLLYSSYIIWFSPMAVHSEKSDALIFDRFDGSLYLLPKKMPKDLECGAWAIACPAETPAEHDFVERYSFTSNALFVKEICSRGSKATELKKITCENPHNISVSYKARNATFQFGFEIYHELKDEQYYHRDIVSGDYRRITDVTDVLRTKFKKGIFVFKEAFRIIKKAFRGDVKEVWLNRDRRMGFLWFYLFKISFDFWKKILKMAWYEINVNNKWTIGEQCENYNLGQEVYGDTETNVDALYVAQQDIFTTFIKWPAPLEDYCENGKCLTKWLLVPIDQFHFGQKTKPLCSNMATIPIWVKKVENIMKKVDTFLYTLFRVLKEPLVVVAGIQGELNMPKIQGRGKTTVYLDPKYKKIPVPKIIYKIVEHRLKECKDEENCTYSAVIIIHNDPYFTEKDKLCRDDMTSSWGWEELMIDFESNYSNMIYVCENNASLQKKLSIGSKTPVAGGLNLMKFPFYNVNTLKVEYFSDFKDKVNKLYHEFRKNGVIPKESDQVIERGHTPSNTIDSDAKSDEDKEEKEL